jgi:hypothetical protein
MDSWRRAHRILAVLFLLAIPPAAYFSFGSDPDSPHPAVYVPLFPLALMAITGAWMLVRPWVQAWRARHSTGKTTHGREHRGG